MANVLLPEISLSVKTLDDQQFKCLGCKTPDGMLCFHHPRTDAVILIGTNIFPQVYGDLRVDIERGENLMFSHFTFEYMTKINSYYQNPLINVMNGLEIKVIPFPPREVSGRKNLSKEEKEALELNTESVFGFKAIRAEQKALYELMKAMATPVPPPSPPKIVFSTGR